MHEPLTEVRSSAVTNRRNETSAGDSEGQGVSIFNEPAFRMNDKATKSPTSVLIAEDHAATRFMLSSLLERHGYHVTAVNDGYMAQGALAAPDGPAIALLDWGLPHQTGLEICR